MKNNLLYIILLLFALSCKSKSVLNTENYSENYWKFEDVTIDSLQTKISAYIVLRLDEALFFNDLKNDKVVLPDLQGNFNTFKIEKTGVMSPELAEKFPEIQTYKGVQVNNALCQARISFNNKKPDIAVMCNDVTYYIKKLNNQKQYILYDKQALQNTLSE